MGFIMSIAKLFPIPHTLILLYTEYISTLTLQTYTSDRLAYLVGKICILLYDTIFLSEKHKFIFSIIFRHWNLEYIALNYATRLTQWRRVRKKCFFL